MDIGDIVKNSLGYPLSNTKNFLILGLLILLAELYSISLSLGVKNVFLVLLIVLTFIISIFREGYNLRILGSSIGGSDVVPDFGNWKRMFIDGIKLFIVTMIYIIPLILILFVVGMFMGIYAASSGGSYGSFGIMFMVILAIVGLYIIIVYPVLLMAFANMAYNDNNMSYALKFGEIQSKISDLGLGSYVGWYIVTGIIYAVLLVIGFGLSSVFGLVHVKFIGLIINAIIVTPFATLFLMRSTSLMYRSALEVQAEYELEEDPEVTL